jgi:hypothetical protein
MSCSKNLIFVNGPMGVGKSATCRQLLDLLQPAVYLDGDWCWMMKPWSATPQNIAMVRKNIVFILRQYLANPELENVVLGWVMHKPNIVTGLIGALPLDDVQVHVFSLVCSPEALKRRIMIDVANETRSEDVIQRSLERLPLYASMPWPKIDVSEISAREAACRIAGQVRRVDTPKPEAR